MIAKRPFGRTGHQSSRVVFGAAALAAMRPERAEQTLQLLGEYGVNHIDVAASYGEAEDRLAPFLRTRRGDVFLATKTGDRDGDGARASLERSLERMQTDRVDLIQLHNLVDEEGWQRAFAPGGAVDALATARDEGLARFIGVTGHGTRVAAMHRRSLERFPFDSVLVPYNFTMLAQPRYAAELDALLALCAAGGVAVQTIKSVARRRWSDDTAKRFSWYEPLEDPGAIRRAVHFVLGREDLFLNTSSDARLLRPILDAASEDATLPMARELEADVERFAIEPLFVPGIDGVG